MLISQNRIKRLRKLYPIGTMIVLDLMVDDPCSIEPGTKGKVISVDDIGTVHCAFENGRRLGLIAGVDRFHVDYCPADKCENIKK